MFFNTENNFYYYLVAKIMEKRLAEVLYPLADDFSGEFLESLAKEYESIPPTIRKGRPVRITLAAIAYRKLLEEGEPVLLHEVCEWFDADKRITRRTFRKIYGRYMEPSVEELIGRFYPRYSRIREKMIDFYERNKDILDRHSPSIAVATCVHLLIGLSQRGSALKLGVTDASIRGVIKELKRAGRITDYNPRKR